MCHTEPNGVINAGGRAIETPLGVIYSTNITPDPTTGIGAWSYPAFERAMREGIHRDGRQLYPAFPYTHFSKTTDADMQALYAYLMAQAPVLPVGRPCYHALTFGWLCEGLVRRVAGRSVAELVASDLAGPLELDLRIGLRGDAAAAGRLARLRRAPGYQLSALAVDDPDPRLELVYGNPPLGDFVADVGWLQPPVASANGIATARAMAALYGALVTGELVSDAVLAAALETASAGADPLSGRPLRFGATLQSVDVAPLPDAVPSGSSHGGWPQLRTGFSFVTSELRLEDLDQRSSTLLATLYGCVGG